MTKNKKLITYLMVFNIHIQRICAAALYCIIIRFGLNQI